jgi:NAD-dependent histone deacetylase SIR2
LQICLLGDADTIVTYLSRQLGWQIPPPPVHVKEDMHGETVGDDLDTKETERLDPERLEWESGVGVL